MPRVFAIADLHLSTSGAKPMDVFGEVWNDHADRMAEAWDRAVDENDTVLLPGDLSWARTLEEASGDLSWIGMRPGRKILLRGNHDSWWRSVSKVRGALPESCQVLQNDAHQVGDGRVVVGARGWTAPDDPWGSDGDAKIHRRELERLRMSVVDADRRFSRDLPRIAMVHFPPWIVEREPSGVVEILERAGVSVCVFGHLHAEDHALGVQGERRGIRYVLVAADAIGFAPVEISP